MDVNLQSLGCHFSIGLVWTGIFKLGGKWVVSQVCWKKVHVEKHCMMLAQ